MSGDAKLAGVAASSSQTATNTTVAAAATGANQDIEGYAARS